MPRPRDYQQWHHSYDGPMRVVSACAGDGRDVLGVLAQREDAARVSATLIELHPDIAQKAADSASAARLTGVEVRIADAGNTDAYAGAVPAQLVILVGIFGNISERDLERTIRAAPQFCTPGGTLLWSRGRGRDDRNDAVRAWFADTGFTELDYAANDTGDRPALGAMRFDGEPDELDPGRALFAFLR